MSAMSRSISLIVLLAAVSPTAWGCDGPNCPTSARNAFSSTRSQFGSRYDAQSFDRAGLSAPQIACGCNSCDPRVPCSPTACARQGCQDCGTNCPTCPSSRFNGSAPVIRLPATGTYRSGSQPTRSRTTAQSVCPVTGEKLGSMGPPIPLTVMGRTVYVCCEGCVNTLRRNPEKYLSTMTPRATMPTTDRPTSSNGQTFR